MNLVILTARMDSERLPGKALIDIAGAPNLARIVTRFRKCRQVNEIVVATTVRDEDDAIVQWCRTIKARFHRGAPGKLIEQVHDIARQYKADYVLRATCDAPFISWELVDLAFQVVAEHEADTGRLWGMPDRTIAVYGAAEFPYSYKALERMRLYSQGEERKHPGMHLDAHRLEYKVVNPVPPCAYRELFYRPYRLELDTPDDLKLVRTVVEALGDAPLAQVVRYLDAHDEVARLNAHISERTGPLTSFQPGTWAEWKAQQATNSIEWRGDWNWLTIGAPSDFPQGAQPLYCSKGTCYIGYALKGRDHVHRLYRPDGTVLTGRASVACKCGANREWFSDSKHGGET